MAAASTTRSRSSPSGGETPGADGVRSSTALTLPGSQRGASGSGRHAARSAHPRPIGCRSLACRRCRTVSARTAGTLRPSGRARPAGRGDLRRGCRGGRAAARPGLRHRTRAARRRASPARRPSWRPGLRAGAAAPRRLGAGRVLHREGRGLRARVGVATALLGGASPRGRGLASGGAGPTGRRLRGVPAGRTGVPRAERRRRTLSARTSPTRPGRLLVRRPGRLGARPLRTAPRCRGRFRSRRAPHPRRRRRRSCRAAARGAAPARDGPGRDGRSAATRHRPGRGARRSPPCPRGTGRGPPHRGCARGGCSPGSGPAAALRCGADRRTAKRTRPGRGPGARPTAVGPRPGRARRRTARTPTRPAPARGGRSTPARTRRRTARRTPTRRARGSWWALEAACPVPARPNWGVAAATSVPGARCGNGPDGGWPCRAPVGGCAAASGRVAEVCPAKSGRSSPGCGSKSAAPPSWGGTRWVPVGGWPPARPYSGAAGWAPPGDRPGITAVGSGPSARGG